MHLSLTLQRAKVASAIKLCVRMGLGTRTLRVQCDRAADVDRIERCHTPSATLCSVSRAPCPWNNPKDRPAPTPSAFGLGGRTGLAWIDLSCCPWHCRSAGWAALWQQVRPPQRQCQRHAGASRRGLRAHRRSPDWQTRRQGRPTE